MTYNLFIAYDLLSPGQNYDRLRDAIKELGPWHQFQLSLFYVNTPQDPAWVFNHLSRLIDINDKLPIINAQSGVVSNWDNPPIEAINAIWTKF